MLDDAQRVECQALVFNKLLVGTIIGSVIYVAYKVADKKGLTISREKSKSDSDSDL